MRATTALVMGMSYPAWQLILGGVGKPTMQKKLIPTEVRACAYGWTRIAQGLSQVMNWMWV